MAFALDLTGTILDRRYRITGLLGKGGMGHVYEAVHVALDQRVAVKVLHPRYANEERFRERFLQEARAASRIRHPNVVEIKDFGDTPDGSVYFAMEYLGGHDVGVELRQHGALPWARTRRILLQATGALHAAHQSRIIHRDIKPGNCFLIEDASAGLHDVVKLLDFGIAKVGSDSHADAQGKGLTGTGEVFGTASYMAPEQARGELLDARSDMYSLGIMAYEMLTGEVPFTGVNAIHVITRHLNDQPEPLRRRVREIPAVVEALVLKMIAKEARDRYPSMEALERALEEIPEDAGVRRTRLWSSPGDLRALVEEKKAGGKAPPLPTGAGTDVERTAVVLPATGRKAGAPGVAAAKAPPAAAVRSPVAAGARRDAPPVKKVNGTVAGEVITPPLLRDGTTSARPTAASATKLPHGPEAKPAAAARTAVAALRVSKPPLVAASSVTPARSPSPKPVVTTPASGTSIARAPSPSARPMDIAVQVDHPGPRGSVVAGISGPTPVLPVTPAVVVAPAASVPVAPLLAPGAPMASVMPLYPSVVAPLAANERFDHPMSRRTDGTNPPPGRIHPSGPSGSWPAVTSGPLASVARGSGDWPQPPQPVAAVPWRLIAVVGLLVVLVGVVSVVGTMIVLSGRRSAPSGADVNSASNPNESTKR